MSYSLTPRANLLAALDHREPERLPIDFGGRHCTMHTLAHQNLKRYLGLGVGPEVWRQFWQQTVAPDPRLIELLGGDVACFACGAPDAFKSPLTEPGLIDDEWGTRYERHPDGLYYDMCYEPLQAAQSEADLAAYAWPNPHDPGRTRGLASAVRQAARAGDKAIMLAGVPGLWEHGWFVHGLAESLMDLAANPAFYGALLDRLLEWEVAVWTDMLAEVGDLVDIVVLSGDLGAQNGPMVSPRSFRKVMKPRLAALVAAVRKQTRAKIYLHSCGSVDAFIPDFIEVGIDILNPVQVDAAAMAPEHLKSEYGRDIVFWGGGCPTRVLEYGTPEEVRAETERCIAALAPGGGYVFGPIHNIQAHVPPENILALFAAAKAYVYQE